MKAFKGLVAAAVVGFGFAGTASAADPVKKGGVIVHGGVSQGVIVPTVVVPQHGVKILPHPYPTNPGPFPPKPPVVVTPRVDVDYVVVYKASIFSPVRTYGKFETLNAARFAAQRLELFGYPVKIVPVRDFHHGWTW